MVKYSSSKRLSFDELGRLAEVFENDVEELGIARSSDLWIYSLPEIQNRKSKNLVREIGLIRVED